MSINNPIINQPFLYVQGLSVGQGSTTTWTIASGAARDSSNVADIILPATVTLSTSRVGVNALDTGTIAASSHYAIYVIGDSTGNHATAGIASLNQSAPLLPNGYDMYRRVGWGFTASNTQTTALWQTGTGQVRAYYYNTTFPVILTAGAATTFTAVSTLAGVPISTPQDTTEGFFKLTYASASAANTVDFGVPGTTQPILSVSNGAAETTITNIWLLVRGDSLSYRTTSGSDSVTLVCTGFKDYL